MVQDSVLGLYDQKLFPVAPRAYTVISMHVYEPCGQSDWALPEMVTCLYN